LVNSGFISVSIYFIGKEAEGLDTGFAGMMIFFPPGERFYYFKREYDYINTGRIDQ
jgi:hypothetical protein